MSKTKSAEILEIIEDAFKRPPTRQSLSDDVERILAPLEQPLLAADPRHSQAAEAAVVIMAFSLREGRVLDLRKGSGDVDPETGRLPGDRTVGDGFCERVLAPRSIPATKGPFQSSTWRSGYDAAQVRGPGLSGFVKWHATVTLPDLQQVFERLIATFASSAAVVEPLPKLDASALTFARFRAFLDLLFAEKSGGAFEQYVFAAVLEQETATTGRPERVTTKSVRSSDAATGAAGDVLVRRGGRVVAAFEVTARPWKTKLPQLTTSARAGLTEVTIVAAGVNGALRGEDLEVELALLQAELAVDVSVLDLLGTLDVLSARLSRFERADAIRRVYVNLVQWHRREPHLISSFVACVDSAALALEDLDKSETVAAPEDADFTQARELLRRLVEEESEEVILALKRIAADDMDS